MSSEPSSTISETDRSDEEGSQANKTAEHEPVNEEVEHYELTEEDLQQLVEKVKNFTTLFDLRLDDFTDEVVKVIETFFLDGTEDVLTIYYDENRLCAQLGFPDIEIDDLTYFVKEEEYIFGPSGMHITSKKVITPENFYETITFGTVDNLPDASILSIINTVFAPIFYNINVWPDSVKGDFCSHLNTFLGKLTDLRYKLAGLTAIHVPKEGIGLSIEQAARDKRLIKRIEDCVIEWTCQIQTALDDTDQSRPYDMFTPFDEFEFWKYRYENLCGVNGQLDKDGVKYFTTLLEATQSTHIERFKHVTEKIEQAMVEAQSNVEFLQIIEEPCKELELVESPNKVPELLPHILFLFRTISARSPYYYTEKKLVMLCNGLSNQIISVCTKYVDMNVMFSGKSQAAKQMFETCINCCNNYKEIFECVASYKNKSYPPFDYKKYPQIFNKINTFIQRCKDMVEICEAMVIFGRMDETIEIPKPSFALTRAFEFESVCDKIEGNFKLSLKKIESVQDSILDVNSSSWYEDMLQFRREMKDLEVIVENLLSEVFATVMQATEGLDVLQNLYQYSKRKDLFTEFEKRTVKVFTLFAQEIQETRKELVEDKHRHPMGLPRYAGRALMAKLKKKRLQNIMKKIDDAQWLMYCPIEEEVRMQYNKLMATLDETAAALYRKWLVFTSSDIGKRFQRPLLVWSPRKPGLLEVNIDRKLLTTCEEARHWMIMDYRIPPRVEFVLENSSHMLLLYRNVEQVMMDYNHIISSLSDQERVLFRELIKECDHKIQPGLTKLTWDTDMGVQYIAECTAQLEQIQAFVDDYKNCNVEIVKLCEKICDTPFIDIPVQDGYTLKELISLMKDVRHETLKKLVDHYNDVFKYLVIVFEGFESHIHQMKVPWSLYLKKMDSVFEESLRLCTVHSIQKLLTMMTGDGTTGPVPLIAISTCLENKKIEFTPTIEQVHALSKNILPDIIIALQIFPRLTEKFHLHHKSKPIPYASVIEMDPECRKLQRSVEHDAFQGAVSPSSGGRNTEEEETAPRNVSVTIKVTVAVGELRQYLKSWDNYREIWEIDRDLFMSRYEKRNPSAEAFDNDIGRYEQFMNQVNEIEVIAHAHFFVVNSTYLKDDVIRQCNEWQLSLTQLLFRILTNQIESIYKYTTENGKRINIPPKTLKELVEFINYHKQMREEVPVKEMEFPLVKDALYVLWRYADSVPMIMEEREQGLKEQWKKYLKNLDEAEEMLNNSQDTFRTGLLDAVDVFKRDAANFLEEFLTRGPFTSDYSSKDAVDMLQEMHRSLLDMLQREKQLGEDLGIFNISQPLNEDLRKLEKEMKQLLLVWELTAQWDETWEQYKIGGFWELKLDDMEIMAQTLYKKFTTLLKELREKNWEIIEHSRRRVDAFRRVLPLINDLKNPAMRERHWDRVKAAMNREFDQNSAEFTLEFIINMKMQDFADAINDISASAAAELQIENGLKTISETWEKIELEMMPHKDTGIYRLVAVDDIFQTLEENQVLLSAMKSTRHVQPFVQDVDYWERTLSVVMEVLEAMLIVQRQYLYLENIFIGEDIRKQLPAETHDFDILTFEWTAITARMYEQGKALDATHHPGMLDALNKMNEKMEMIQRALEQYLETKRHIFPRFYFISNDDLLEILGNSRKPEMVQPHFKKLFDNINKVSMLKNTVTGKIEGAGMQSADGESIEFNTNIALEGPVELWLCKIETEMQSTLRNQLKLVRVALKKYISERDKWIKEWPGQMCITASQIQWTVDSVRTLRICKVMESRSALKKLKKKQNSVLSKFSDAIRGNLSKIQRLKIVSLITIEIHARDVIEQMYKKNCMDVTAFEWLSQLRFYWDKDIDDCVVRQTNTQFGYGYEYLGNSGRLVITPLTDRCYITLTTALHLHRGGSPKGPAGTGKTETVKDLGKALAYYVIVINCSEGLDYKSMGRMFSGLAQTGAWGCFDEFNRINIEVLSVVAQQILSILSALSQKQEKFVFEGQVINLKPTCGIFITMNPGYAGRTELPDNLKSMFRPISMMVPDSMLIAEISLFGEGFRDTRNLAKKVYTLFQLAQQQLSKQDHYDFGLRGMVSLVRHAGRKRRQFPTMPDEEVVLLAMKDMNLAKLTADDLPLFSGITGDLFPGIVLLPIDYGEMITAIRDELLKNSLQPIEASVNKVIQLYETKTCRHSVMIVGKTGAAKTTTWKVLKGAMTQLKNKGVAGYESVMEYPINPKALNIGELYGEYNIATNEWSDGVLSAIMRKTCSDEEPDEKWILFDGPVDAVWIENMNSVMDDNKVLTLINSERITMPEQVSLVFEVEDLAVASPATVSRCGMVYNDYKDFGWQPYVTSWLNSQPSKIYAAAMQRHFDLYVSALLDFKRLNCEEIVPLPELSSVEALCKLLTTLATEDNGLVKNPDDIDEFNHLSKLWFLFCITWSICAGVNKDGRRKIDTYIREIEGVYPLKDTIYEYFVDPRSRSFAHWEIKLSDTWKFNSELPFFKIIVPTVDSVRYNFLTKKLLQNRYPVLLLGTVGTGKTSTAESVLNELDRNKYCLLTINMSAQTTSLNVQEAIESKVEKRTKGVYVPLGGKTMITHMDDLNMPAKEIYGAQPPLELIRQWINYSFWYDRQKQTPKYIKDMLLLGSMGPPGGARNDISNRLLSRFCTINITFPDEAQIMRIFGTMLSQHLIDFDDSVKNCYDELTVMTIRLYNSIVTNMLPTPAKMHYLFNLRDISKVFQGLLRSSRENINSKNTFLRLWIHECFRVFSDRLIDDRDQEWFLNEVSQHLGSHFDVTFHSVCPTKSPPIFCDFMNKYNMYEDISDMTALRTHIEKQLDEYNVAPGVIKMNLVLFKDAVEHICRIVRVISQPRGNILLVGIGSSVCGYEPVLAISSEQGSQVLVWLCGVRIHMEVKQSHAGATTITGSGGGSGRQSLARIAAWLCTFNTFQVQVKRNYKLSEFKEDLKGLYFATGVKDTPTSFVFNDTQVSEESFLEVINCILSTGEISNLYRQDEFDEIKNALVDMAKKAGVIGTNEAMHNFFIDRVRSNLHVVLCMSPIGDAFRARLRQYPAIVNCTTIDWFLEWPKDALLEVAQKFLQDVDMLKTITGAPREIDAVENIGMTKQERLRLSVASIFSTIHSSVTQFSRTMLLEMKRHNYVTPTNYLELVTGYKQMLSQKRLELAVLANKLRNGLFKIDETKIKVQEMSVELEIAKAQVNQMTQECDDFLQIIAAQTREADEQQKLVAAESVKIKEEEIICKQLADAALADLQEAMPALEEALQALDALNKKDLAEIKSYGRPPARVEMVLEAVMILKQVEPTWAEAKRQLGDPFFLTQLRDFDKDHISDKTLRKIAIYTSNEEFEPEKVGIVSIAAKSLCLWVIAIEKYGKAYRVVAPKKAKLEEAEASLHEKQVKLAAAIAKVAELQKLLDQLKADYDEKIAQKEELTAKAELLAQKLERAAQLVDGLSGELVRWEQTVERLDKCFDFLPGDCLMGTAYISYMGPFVSVYRQELLELWVNAVNEEEIPYSPEFTVSTFLCDPTTIREWNIHGLPSDDFSTENGIIITKGTRWPLIIDPQNQAWKWIKNMHSTKGLRVVDFGQPDYMQTIELALRMGWPVLLQNVMEQLDPPVTPVLQKSFVRQGGELMMKMGDRLVPYNTRFSFYITTKMSNPHFAPEISTSTTLVNFAIKQEGLEDQLLGIVVRKEKPQLEEQKDSLVLNIAAGKRTLIELEDELLRLLNESKGSLLDNIELLTTLQTSKATSIAVNEQLENSLETEVEIDKARECYRPSATRASILFFGLMDMGRIDPMYQFSLDSYISLFILSIEKSKKTEILEDRINYLNDYHTYSVYRNTCRGLFEHHKLLFSFHMCIKILDAAGKVSDYEYQFMLKGGVVLNREEQPDNPCAAWMPEPVWDNITELDKVAGFHGVISSFEQFPRDWKEWYSSTEPETMPLIGEWQDVCTEFQRMLFVRCLRPDRMSFCLSAFTASNLGPRFTEPPVLDVNAVLDDSSNRTPLIFVLSPGVDPTSGLIQLAEQCNMADRFQSLSLGQGQAPIATRLIEKGKEEGLWVFLANCHLSLSWMPQLDKIVELLQSGQSHKDFRLWLSSSPHPDFPISILQSSIKMTTEPPKGIRANMKRLYQLITEEKFSACQCQSKYKKLLFSLCFFHSVLLERKKFQQLGWNVVYSFNDSDFEVSESLLTIYLDEYSETAWDALKYLIAGVNYGGHVTDDWDRRLLLTYINQYFNEDTLNVPFYRLSSIPKYYIPRDGTLQSYKDYIITLPTVDQPQAFGQHPNADIMSLIIETRMICETLMSIQVQTSSGKGVASGEEKVLQLAAEVVSKIPEPVDYETTERLIGPNKTPLDVVLLQEISRYNILLVEVKGSLEDLQKGIKGMIVMSEKLEEIYTCIFEGRVPSTWLKMYPSLKPLGSWTRDLMSRVEHFSQWAETQKEPILFWLAAYTFPTGFLTAVLQTSARQLNISIDLLNWEFVPQTLAEYDIVFPSEEGVYVRGLYLEGAGWDKKSLSLTEPAPMQLVCPMPVILFKPCEVAKKRLKGMYACPLYYYPIRHGSQNRASYVVSVELKSGQQPADHWVKRATAMLLSLAD